MRHTLAHGLAALGGTLILAPHSHGNFQRLVALLHHNDGAGHDVFRVYAEFTNPNDYVGNVTGNIVNPMVIQSRNSTDSGVGSAFYNGNPPLQTNNLAPYDATSGGGTWQHGTFVTIGIPQVVGYGTYASYTWSDAITTAPGFPSFITGTSLSNNNMGWGTLGANEQGRAGHINSGQDTATRVLIMQLSVNTGGNVRGTVSVGAHIDLGNGSYSHGTIPGQTFNSFTIPAPGAMALLVVAGLAGAPQRRR